MSDITFACTYSKQEWAELETEARRQKRKVREFIRNAPIAVARAQALLTKHTKYQPKHHQPIEETQHARNRPGSEEPGAV